MAAAIMKRKRTSLNSSSSSQQQLFSSSTKTTTVAAQDLYLPEECWESIFTFLNNDGDNKEKSLPLVSKQFLSITNRLRSSLTIRSGNQLYFGADLSLSCLFERFTNITSLDLTHFYGNFNHLLYQMSRFPLKLTSLNLYGKAFIRDENEKMFTSVFSNLQRLNLDHCYNISRDDICQVLRRCSKIRHLNLTWCSIVNLHRMNFEVLKLEVLKLSKTTIDDEALNAISKSCRGLLQLLLEHCWDVTDEGVKHVIENCTQLREISLRGCYNVDANIVDSMIFSMSSSRKIIVPSHSRFRHGGKELFLNHVLLSLNPDM